MKRKKIDRHLFNLTLGLMVEQPWLQDLNKPLLSLLEECTYERQQSLVIELLSNFEFLDYLKMKQLLERTIFQIFNEWGLSDNNTQIVAMTYDDSADSGQSLLWSLQPLLAQENKHPKLVNRVGSAIRHLEQYPNIVLFDEFAGTGSTVANRVKQIRADVDNVMKNKKWDFEVSIRAIVLVGMESTRNTFESLNIDYCCFNWLKKGIAQNYAGVALKKAYKDMLRLESYLANEDCDKPLPSLGYGRAEALYYHEGGNLPNSVFPVFWWPKSYNGENRMPLFFRFQK